MKVLDSALIIFFMLLHEQKQERLIEIVQRAKSLQQAVYNTMGDYFILFPVEEIYSHGRIASTRIDEMISSMNEEIKKLRHQFNFTFEIEHKNNKKQFLLDNAKDVQTIYASQISSLDRLLELKVKTEYSDDALDTYTWEAFFERSKDVLDFPSIITLFSLREEEIKKLTGLL